MNLLICINVRQDESKSDPEKAATTTKLAKRTTRNSFFVLEKRERASQVIDCNIAHQCPLHWVSLKKQQHAKVDFSSLLPLASLIALLVCLSSLSLVFSVHCLPRPLDKIMMMAYCCSLFAVDVVDPSFFVQRDKITSLSLLSARVCGGGDGIRRQFPCLSLSSFASALPSFFSEVQTLVLFQPFAGIAMREGTGKRHSENIKKNSTTSSRNITTSR